MFIPTPFSNRGNSFYTIQLYYKSITEKWNWWILISCLHPKESYIIWWVLSYIHCFRLLDHYVYPHLTLWGVKRHTDNLAACPACLCYLIYVPYLSPMTLCELINLSERTETHNSKGMRGTEPWGWAQTLELELCCLADTLGHRSCFRLGIHHKRSQ